MQKFASIDEYLECVRDDEQRGALQKLRKQIHAAAPGAEECFSYGLPAFRLKGITFAAFAACATHCSYYPMSGSIAADFKDELKGFDMTKGSIHFTPEKPLAAGLVRKLVKARLALKKK